MDLNPVERVSKVQVKGRRGGGGLVPNLCVLFRAHYVLKDFGQMWEQSLFVYINEPLFFQTKCSLQLIIK